MAQIHELIGKAMTRIGAIGKDSFNSQQKFKYRGIDAVYNALNPVMAELGLFICPEILEQHREERVTQSGGLLKYTILTVKYTMFAPDGSSVSMTVVGEGMDSGDKSSNKAMSVAMKYAMFQLFMIPTEELVDPDRDVYPDVMPKAEVSAGAIVQAVNTVPDIAPPAPPKPAEPTEAQKYLLKAMKELREARGITAAQNNKLFAEQRNALIAAGLAPDKKLEAYTLAEAEALIEAMYANFDPEGTEIRK